MGTAGLDELDADPLSDVATFAELASGVVRLAGLEPTAYGLGIPGKVTTCINKGF